MIIELAGLLYGAVKDLKDYLRFDEEDTLVDIHWPEKSGFQTKAEQDGFKLHWSRSENVASRELEGYEVMFEVDKVNRKRRRLVLYDGNVLLGKRV